MQFALMIYHSPEEFAMRKNDYNDPNSAPGGLTTRRSSRPASMSRQCADCPRQERHCAFGWKAPSARWPVC